MLSKNHTHIYTPETTHIGRQKAVFLMPSKQATDAFVALEPQTEAYAQNTSIAPKIHFRSTLEITHFSAEDIRRRGSVVWEMLPHSAGLLEGYTAVRVNLAEGENIKLSIKLSDPKKENPTP